MRVAIKNLLSLGILICLVGAFFMVIVPTIVGFALETSATERPLGAFLIDFVLTLLRWGVMPVGSFLIATAIALKVLQKNRVISK